MFHTASSVSADKMLDLKGDSSIIITVYPCIMEDDSYLIELFDNGVLETTVGKVNKEAFYGEFTGRKEVIFEKIKEKRKKYINRDEAELINEMIGKLDFSKVDKKNLKKQVADDAWQRMIWINNKAYYYCGTLPNYSEVTQFIEQIVKFSSIKISMIWSRRPV